MAGLPLNLSMLNYAGVSNDLPVAPSPASQAAPVVAPPADPAANAVTKQGPAADIAPEQEDPFKGMSPGQIAEVKLKNGLPMDMRDMYELDNMMQARGLIRGAGSSTTSTTRANQPHGAEWDALQAESKQGLNDRVSIRNDAAQRAADNARAQNADAMQRAQEADAHGQELQKMADRQLLAEADYRAEGDKLQAQQDAAHRDYMKASKEYDPNRLMHGSHAGLAALSMALGAFGASLTHSQNFAMDIINGMIERDIDKQKMGIAGKKDEVTWLDHVKADVRTRFTDENAARLATRAAAKEVWAEQTLAHANKMQGQEAIAKGQQISDQFRLESQQDRQRATEIEMAAKRAAAGTSTSASTSQTAGNSMADVIGRMKGESEALISRDKAMGLTGGKNKLSPADASFTNKQLGALTELGASNKQLDELEKKRGESNSFSRALGIGNGAEQNVAEEAASQAYGRAISGTQSSEPEHERIHRVIRGGAFDFSDEAKNRGPEELKKNLVAQAKAKFQSIPDAAKPAAAERLKSFGFTPAQLREILGGAGSADSAAALVASDE